MEDLLDKIKSLILEKVALTEWRPILLRVLVIYSLGFFFGILPSLLNRKRRRLEEQCSNLCEEILEKICGYDELYNLYIREPDSSKKTVLENQISGAKKDLKELELRLARLEQREPRKLPLRPLPVRKLKIE